MSDARDSADVIDTASESAPAKPYRSRRFTYTIAAWIVLAVAVAGIIIAATFKAYTGLIADAAIMIGTGYASFRAAATIVANADGATTFRALLAGTISALRSDAPAEALAATAAAARLWLLYLLVFLGSTALFIRELAVLLHWA